MNRDEDGFFARCDEARRMCFSFRDPLIVHHYDADGVSAGAIVAGAFLDAGKKFRRECIKKLDDDAIDRYLGARTEAGGVKVEAGDHAGAREDEIIFVDLGGGNKRVNELQDVVVIDHHQIEGIDKMQANPLLFGIDGGNELSAAGTAYCVFRSRPDLAIVGAVGDMMHPLIGMNRWVLAEGEKSGDVRVEEDLRFYGRYCRPLVQFLAYCDDPYLPGISYREEKAQELLNELGIPLESETRAQEVPRKTLRVYADLNPDEKKILVSALAKLLVNANRLKSAEELIGESCIFPKRLHDETFEANEFSTLLNACGRHGKPEIGIGVCLNDGEAKKEAQGLLSLHRRMLRQGVEFASNHVQDFGAFYFLDGRGTIDEGLIGVICGMVLQSGWSKPIIGMALGERDTIKVSGRAGKALVAKGLNLGELMKGGAAECGGVGGGHRMAAGASIPKDRINEFLLFSGRFLQGR